MKKEKKSFLKIPAIQSLLASIICILLGLIVGYIVLLFINPGGATEAILVIIKNYFKFLDGGTTATNWTLTMKNLGNTLVKTAPLLMCSLSVLFCYKAGLFNIGVAGQYCMGAGIALYAALGLNLPWWACMLLAMLSGALLAAISGLLKAYCNVNEVISGIMLNWITLYSVNMLLETVKETTSPYTKNISNVNTSAFIPSLGLSSLFGGNKYVGLAIPLSIVFAIIIWVILEKTTFGYELKATGFNKNAAKYCGMAEKRNTVLTLMIGGALAGTGASMLYLTGVEQWSCSLSSVPAMGFNGIAAAFLGGINPIGAIFASYIIQHITDAGAFVDKSYYCSQISDLISSIIIYLCGFVLFIKLVMNRYVAKKEEARKKEAVKASEALETAENKEGGAE